MQNDSNNLVPFPPSSLSADVVPLRPATRRRMRHLLAPKVEVSSLAAMAAHDPGFAFHLLRLANRYATTEPVFHLEHAIFAVEGFDLVSLTRPWKLFCSDDSIEALGAHSRLTALIARRIAEFGGGCEPDKAYVAALLHDVGKIVLAARDRSGSHCSVGRELALDAQLPPFIVDTVANHHRPEAADTDSKIVKIVAIADQLAHGLTSPQPLHQAAGMNIFRNGLQVFFDNHEAPGFITLMDTSAWFQTQKPDISTRREVRTCNPLRH